MGLSAVLTLLFGIAVAGFVFRDARRRGASPRWALGALIAGPIALGFYFARRPLRDGEVREGGRGWNVLRNFVVWWTALAAVHALGITVEGVVAVASAASDAERVVVVLAAATVLGAVAMMWFFVMIAALLVGYFVRNPAAVEHGPTGALALAQGEQDRLTRLHT